MKISIGTSISRSAPAALGLEAGRQIGDHERPAIGPGEADVALDRVGLAEVVAQIDRHAGDLVVAGGPGLLPQQAGDVPGERLADRSLRGHRCTGCEASSSASSHVVAVARPASSPGEVGAIGRVERGSARRSSRSEMPFLMLWSVLTTSPSSPTRTLTAYSSAPRRTSSAPSCASPMIRRLSASACWVSPRSSIRNAACSWARATIRSASSWAFSMIRSPSELIRFAARTSSGTATRSSSMRPSAAAWSMTTLFVEGKAPAVRDDRLEALDEEDDVDRSGLRWRVGSARGVVGGDYRMADDPTAALGAWAEPAGPPAVTAGVPTAAEARDRGHRGALVGRLLRHAYRRAAGGREFGVYRAARRRLVRDA